MLGFQLSPEQVAIRDRARAFMLKEILPVAWRSDAQNETPLPLLRKAWEQGIMNADIPAEYGGQGRGLVDNVLITEELAAGCAGLATSIFDNSLGMEPLRLCGNPALKAKILPRLVREPTFICFATSEPTMGSDVAGHPLPRDAGRRRLCPERDQVLDHQRRGRRLHVGFRHRRPGPRHEGICAFLVEKEWAGVSIGRRIPKLGQRGSETVGIRLDNVRVPRANVLAPPGEGFVLAMKTFGRTRPAIGAFAVGAARSAMEFAIDYARRRQAFGSRIGEFQAIQHKIADMFQKVETARLLVWKAAWEADQGLDPTIAASVAKLYSSEIAFEIANEALQIFGGYGYTQAVPDRKDPAGHAACSGSTRAPARSSALSSPATP